MSNQSTERTDIFRINKLTPIHPEEKTNVCTKLQSGPKSWDYQHTIGIAIVIACLTIHQLRQSVHVS